MTLSFQIVFGIVATIEGLSVWKGKSLDGRLEFAKLERKPRFDEERHRRLCDEASSHPGSISAPARLLFGNLWFLAKRGLCPLWNFLCTLPYRLSKLLVLVLRATPLFTIPALALCYLTQWHCKGDEFDFIGPVLVFVVAKAAAYAYCAIVGWILVLKTNVRADRLGPKSISPAEEID